MLDTDNFEIPPCTLTGKTNYEDFPWGAYHLNLTDPIRVARCKDTGMLYLCPRPNKKNRDSILQGIIPKALADYGSKGYNYATVEELRINDFTNRIVIFNKIFKEEQSRTLLDVGTSGGALLDVASKSGWKVQGIEPFLEDVKKCQAKGHDVVQGYAESLPYADNTFDVVHTSHVFEHLEDPLLAAREAYRVLKPGGLLFIEVPNQLDNFGFHRDMFLRNVKQRKRDIASIHHLWFFGKGTLRQLYQRAGFTTIRVVNKHHKTFGGWRLPFSLLSKALSNLFYGTYIIRGFGFKPKN